MKVWKHSCIWFSVRWLKMNYFTGNLQELWCGYLVSFCNLWNFKILNFKFFFVWLQRGRVLVHAYYSPWSSSFFEKLSPAGGGWVVSKATIQKTLIVKWHNIKWWNFIYCSRFLEEKNYSYYFSLGSICSHVAAVLVKAKHVFQCNWTKLLGKTRNLPQILIRSWIFLCQGNLTLSYVWVWWPHL